MTNSELYAMRSRAHYNHWTTVTLRYCDQDPLGHINNAATAAFLEQARIALVYPLLKSIGGPHPELVVARLVIDYLKELSFPGNVEVGSRIDRLGGKSFTLRHAVFMAGEEGCAATAECVMVFFDLVRRESMLPPAAVREALERFMREQPP
ncbi:MAG: acyl-CoA thioesterase [Hyphomicrobiaceae bacterium]|nr:acyl-CoA thioesterase [Hyphomicrobiaceae bacterium]